MTATETPTGAIPAVGEPPPNRLREAAATIASLAELIPVDIPTTVIAHPAGSCVLVEVQTEDAESAQAIVNTLYWEPHAFGWTGERHQYYVWDGEFQGVDLRVSAKLPLPTIRPAADVEVLDAGDGAR